MRPPLRPVLGSRLLLADGAMGTMLQRADVRPEDFGASEGCNDVLNLTRPDVVARVHAAYCAAGADLITTNTFGANLTALGEYGLADRLEALAEAGAHLARDAADAWSTPDRPRWVLGDLGPGTKLASLGQVAYAELRDAYERATGAMIRGGIDAVLIETCPDLLGARAAVAGAKRAIGAAGVDLPVMVSVTLEAGGTLLVGSDLGAVVVTLQGLGVDAIGLNCSTGPDGMRAHLADLARLSPVPLLCQPNAGLPVLTADGAYYPLSDEDFAEQMAGFAQAFGLAVVGGCCGTTPEHIAALAARLGPRRPTPDVRPTTAIGPGYVASTYTATPLAQDVAYLAIGERTNAAGSRAFRDALAAGDLDACVEIGRDQVAEGAHVLDLCVDFVGRDGVRDMAALAGRLAREVDAPLQVDSADPAVIRAALELIPGRAIVNSVNLESGDGPGSRFAETMAAVREHGAVAVALVIDETGQARSAGAKLAVARRLIDLMTNRYGMDERDILIDLLTFPIATGQADTRHDAAATLTALRQLRAEHPGVHTVLGISNVSFGLAPQARVVLNSVFLDECRQAGLSAAIVPAGRIRPLDALPADQVAAARDLVWDRADGGVEAFLALFGHDRATPAEVTAALPVPERLRAHILDGTTAGLEADLAEALVDKPALAIINEDLLGAMKEVGERFGAGRMQLPFVLKSAEVMKRAVTWLEPHLERSGGAAKGTIVLATVRGDVHDIGKNLVDIILSNNGYQVVNLGIKQPAEAIIAAAESHRADAIGLSGLLVKSTQVMAETLAELNARGLARTYPVLLGGAALTRAFVEADLSGLYEGEVRYAPDAFAGLALMEAIMAGQLAPVHRRVPRAGAHSPAGTSPAPARPASGVVPTPPFTGARQGRATLDEVIPFLDTRALYTGRWGLRAGEAAPDRLAYWLDRIRAEDLADLKVTWGYWPCHAEGDDLVVEDAGRTYRFGFPRQPGGGLCLADYFRTAAEAAQFGPDVVGFQLVTAGDRLSRATAGLFAADAYRDYFELHGLSVQLAEALAEFWHARVRAELGLAATTGERYSFGYPACPDLAARTTLVALLQPQTIGVTLSETHQLHPEQSTDALIVHHPQARYFSVR